MRSLGLTAALLLGLTSAPDGGTDTDAFQYVGVHKCSRCHKKKLIGNQWGAWKKSVHARAFQILKKEKAIRFARERGLQDPPQRAGECLRCHATAYGLTANQLAAGRLRLSNGVQCESCHGPGSGYQEKEVMADHDRAVARGLRIPDEHTCVACHNDESPSWDPSRYRLADGSRSGFDFEQARDKIRHAIPKEVKGRYLDLEMTRKMMGNRVDGERAP